MTQPILEVTLRPTATGLRLEWGMPVENRQKRWVYDRRELEVRLYCRPFLDFAKPELLNMSADARTTTRGASFVVPFLDGLSLYGESSKSGFRPGVTTADAIGKFYPVMFTLSADDIPTGGAITYPALEWQVTTPDWEKQAFSAWVVFGYTDRDTFIPVHETPPLEVTPPEGAKLPDLPDDTPTVEQKRRVRRRGATPRLFISYSRTDTFAVNKIAYDLSDRYYYTVWIDYDSIRGGALWRDEIARGIKDAEVVLFMATPTACASAWCREEIDYARRLGKTIIPVKLSSALTPDDLRAIELDDRNWIDFSMAGDTAWSRLLDALPRVLERDRRMIDPAFRKLHRDYLRRAILNRYGKIKLTYLLDAAPKEQVSLLDVYVPLKLGVSFNIEVQGGEMIDWWMRDQTAERRDAKEMPEGATYPKSLNGFMPTDPALAIWRERMAAEWERFKTDHAAKQAEEEEKDREQLKDQTYYWNRIESETAPALMPHVVITGGPGSGKSTLMQHLALCMAGDMLAEDDKDKGQADLDRLDFWPLPAYTPVFLELRPLVGAAFPGLHDTVTLEGFYTYLETKILDGVRGYLEPLKDQMRDGEVLFFLDGLDEVPDAAEEDRRDQIRAFVALLRDTFPDCRIVVTSRPYAYKDWSLGDDFGRVDLIDLDDDRLEQLALRLFRVVLGQEAAEEQVPQFQGQMKRVPGRLRSSPLFFTLLAAIWLNNQKLPPDKRLPMLSEGAIYRECVAMLIRRWTRRDLETGHSVTDAIGLHETDLRRLLEALAYAVHIEARGDSDAVFRSGKIVDTIEDLRLPTVRYDVLLDTLAQRAGIIFERDPKRFQFAHQSFREHLAACHLAVTDFPTRFVRHLGEDAVLWRNVADLLPDELNESQRWTLVKALTPADDAPLPDDPDDPRWRMVAYAGNLLTERLPQGDMQQKLYRPLIARALARLLETGALPPTERAAAGRALAKLGDPRPGVAQIVNGIPVIAWTDPISAGSFTFGKDDKAQTIDLPYAYRIATYPVTYAQFAAFVEHGYRNDTYWTADGLAERGENTHPQQDYWNDPKWHIANHPVVSVTWYEAFAFAAWLNAVTTDKPDPGAVIRLPTEAEWEKAAHGPGGAHYPWGDEYISGYANIDETARYGGDKVGEHFLERTSPVGMYPSGAHKTHGAYDLSGNVLEWCLNEFSKPENIQAGGTNARVVRGGSWLNYQNFARAACRGNFNPNSRFNYIGFRVVLSSPI